MISVWLGKPTGVVNQVSVGWNNASVPALPQIRL